MMSALSEHTIKCTSESIVDFFVKENVHTALKRGKKQKVQVMSEQLSTRLPVVVQALDH